MSSFYLDVVKDRLYADGTDSHSRRSAQTTMHTIADTLARLLAPILVHTSEEVWDYLKMPAKTESVHLAPFPTANDVDTVLVMRWEPVLAVRETVKKALETGRQEGKIGNPLEARVVLHLDTQTFAALSAYEKLLPSVFLVSQVTLAEQGEGETANRVDVSVADGVKCARCWLIKTDVGTDGGVSRPVRPLRRCAAIALNPRPLLPKKPGRRGASASMSFVNQRLTGANDVFSFAFSLAGRRWPKAG